MNINLLAMKKGFSILLLTVCLFLFACGEQQTGMPRLSEETELTPDSLLLPVLPAHTPELLVAADINLTKDLLYDKYTLEDTYPYGDTVRSFKWETIRKCLAFIENMHRDTSQWVVLRNYKNLNSEAPLVRRYIRNAYGRIADTLGVERYQSIPHCQLSVCQSRVCSMVLMPCSASSRCLQAFLWLLPWLCLSSVGLRCP